MILFKNACLTAFLLTTTLGFSQQTDAKSIAQKFMPKNSSLAHAVIETSVWDFPKATIAFYTEDLTLEYKDIVYERQAVNGYFIWNDGKTDRKILIDHFEDDNVDTKILSVFFANADNDKQKELIILTANTHRLQYLYDGTEYNVYIYDDISIKNLPKKFTLLINPKFDVFNQNFEGFQDDKNHKAKFKTAHAIKKELKKTWILNYEKDLLFTTDFIVFCLYKKADETKTTTNSSIENNKTAEKTDPVDLIVEENKLLKIHNDISNAMENVRNDSLLAVSSQQFTDSLTYLIKNKQQHVELSV